MRSRWRRIRAVPRGRRRFLAGAAAVALVATACAAGILSEASRASGISSVTDYAAPGGDPWGTGFDKSGRVWVALPGCDPSPSCSNTTPPGKLGLFDPSTSTWIVRVSLPSGYGQPLFVQVDSAGNVWFTMPVTNAIGEYNPASATVSQWPVPTAGGGPWDLAIDSSGNIWFTEHYVNKIGSFNPATQTFKEISTPATNSYPYGITIDHSGNVWFTENNDAVALIAEYTASAVLPKLNEYKIRNTNTAGTGLTPHLIIIGPNGNPWWSEGWVSGIGTLNLSAATPGTNNGVTEYFYTPSCSSCGSHTSGISADTLGSIWVDDSLQNTFGSISTSGGPFTFYNSPSGGHPHDGLNVDSQNRIWFNEEFANKLAEAIQSGSPPPTTTTAASTTTTSTTVPPGATLAADTFHRANQALWGAASDGLSWGGDANTASAFSISGDAGLVSNTGGTSFSAVLGPSTTDEEAFATVDMSVFSGGNWGDVLRWTDGNDWYKAYIDGASLILQKKVAGNAAILASVPFSPTGGTSYTIHFRIVGSTLFANVWPSTSSEPAGWMVTATDASLTSGFSGMRFLTQAGTATVTNFSADNPDGSPPPTTTTTSASTTTTSTSTTTTVPSTTTTVPSTTTTSPTSTTTTTVPPSTTTTSTSTSTTTTVPPTTTTVPSGGGNLAADTFRRANQSLWGTASDGLSWGGDANTIGAFSISGNAGSVSNTGSASYSAVLGPSATDSEVYATTTMSAFSNGNWGDVLRWTDGNNWYKAYIDGSSLFLQKKVAGNTTMLASVPFTASAGTSYTIHFRVVGSTLSANVWPSTAAEPAGWMVTATDNSFSSGFSGLRFLAHGATVTVTGFSADVPGGGSPPPSTTTTSPSTSTTTVAPTTTTVPSSTTTTSTTLPGGGGVLAGDTFQRANRALWGTASDGLNWGGDANTIAAFSISGNAGLVSNTGSASYSAVLGPSATDSEVYATATMSVFGSSNWGDVLRWTDGNDWYKAFIDGSNLFLQKKVAGSTTILASVPFTASAGTSYTIHFRVVGSTLSANVWPSTATEPAGWMVTATDTSFTSGFCGLRFLTQAGTATISSFQAKTA